MRNNNTNYFRMIPFIKNTDIKKNKKDVRKKKLRPQYYFVIFAPTGPENGEMYSCPFFPAYVIKVHTSTTYTYNSNYLSTNYIH